MSSSRTIALFSERPDLNQHSSSFLVSAVAHAAAFGLLSFGIIYTPALNDKVLTPRYTVRHLDLHTPEPQQSRAAGGIRYPGPQQKMQEPSAGGKPLQQQAALRQTADAEHGPQTLVQPDIPRTAKLKLDIEVPTVVIWTPKKAPANTVVAPLPEQATAADVRPSLNAPNQEVNLADLALSATDLSHRAQAFAPSTTSPLVIHSPDQVQLPPVTTSQSKAEPTPTAVMSLSDVHMTEGSAALPPVNETADRNTQGVLAPGPAGEASRKGALNQASNAGGAGSGMAAGESHDPSRGSAKPAGTKIWPGQGTQAGLGDGDKGTAAHFSLPKDGQFGAVVVGASMKEQFPEVAGLWNDRLAYTVYLHVGLQKSWIMQYSLPRAAEAAAGGKIGRLEAPWPYNIVRPNLAPGTINADALMVHGYVNQAGRFEQLAVAFPPEFAQAQYVLGALEQWQFRPAAQNGQLQRVEVVLIIPEELE